MATNFDLQEQEQLDNIKHFWATWGMWISGVVLVAVAAWAGWTGYKYWQDRQAHQAAALYDAVEQADQLGDLDRLQQAFDDIKQRYAGTTYAQHAGLLAAKTFVDKGRSESARDALLWVTEHAKDSGLVSIARLRLAALQMQLKDYDAALTQLGQKFPSEFAPLVDDRKGDVLVLQGKKEEAAKAYEAAYKSMEPRLEYRRVVEAKLNALGVATDSAAPAAQS